LALLASLLSAAMQRTSARAATAGPYLIKHGWDIPRPQYVHDNVASMEQLGFDGVVIAIPSSMQVFSQTPLSYEQLASELAPLASTKFTTMTHNFVIIYRGDPGPWDGNWSVPTSNIANLSRAAKEVGLEGILYDNEDYSGTNSADWPTAAPNLTLPAAEELVRSIGKQIGAAIAGQWPTATVLTMFGPWASDPATATAITSMPYPNVDWANELLGPFFVGLVQAAQGTQMTIADGGELYSARTSANYEEFYNWNKFGMAQSGNQIPTPLKASYPSLVQVGFTVYDQPAYNQPMDANVWQTTLTNALHRTDRYVVAYTELFDWWGSGWPGTPVPAEWVAATKAAKAAAPSTVSSPGSTTTTSSTTTTTGSTATATAAPTTAESTTTTTAGGNLTNNQPITTPVGGTPNNPANPGTVTGAPQDTPDTPGVGGSSPSFSQTPTCVALHQFYEANGAGDIFLAHHPECRRAAAS
jgi:hypothetical protein